MWLDFPKKHFPIIDEDIPSLFLSALVLEDHPSDDCDEEGTMIKNMQSDHPPVDGRTLSPLNLASRAESVIAAIVIARVLVLLLFQGSL